MWVELLKEIVINEGDEDAYISWNYSSMAFHVLSYAS
jgi:hypothetical protein